MTFETITGAAGSPAKSTVHISNVITEPQFIEASVKLETSLKEGNLKEYCQAKLSSLNDQADKAKLWQFIGASFEENCDHQYLKIMDINLDELNGQVKALIKPADVNGIEKDMSGLDVSSANDEFDMIAAQAVSAPEVITSLDKPFSISKDLAQDQGQLAIALLSEDIELAVDIAMNQNR